MRKVICVVEDEKAINNLVNQYLKKKGYEIRFYYTHEEASVHVMNDGMHLWIPDVMLDGKGGFDLIEGIHFQGRDIPAIFMSVRDKKFDRITGLEKGGDDCITKPFSSKGLVLCVNNVIKRICRDDDNRTMVDDHESDEEQRKASDHGVKVDLVAKEFDLLMLFIKNKGMALNRNKILTSVWEKNYFGSGRVVDDMLWRLRKKLPNLNIHTIYGYGYRLR